MVTNLISAIFSSQAGPVRYRGHQRVRRTRRPPSGALDVGGSRPSRPWTSCSGVREAIRSNFAIPRARCDPRFGCQLRRRTLVRVWVVPCLPVMRSQAVCWRWGVPVDSWALHRLRARAVGPSQAYCSESRQQACRIPEYRHPKNWTRRALSYFSDLPYDGCYTLIERDCETHSVTL